MAAEPSDDDANWREDLLWRGVEQERIEKVVKGVGRGHPSAPPADGDWAALDLPGASIPPTRSPTSDDDGAAPKEQKAHGDDARVACRRRAAVGERRRPSPRAATEGAHAAARPMDKALILTAITTGTNVPTNEQPAACSLQPDGEPDLG